MCLRSAPPCPAPGLGFWSRSHILSCLEIAGVNRCGSPPAGDEKMQTHANLFGELEIAGFSAVFGLQCQQELADRQRLLTGLAVVNPFDLPHFPSNAQVVRLHLLPHSIPGQNEKTEGAMKFLASALVALLFVFVESALGQEPSWDKLMKLSPGSRMEVVDAQSSTVQGQLVSIDEQGLTLRRRGGVAETIARADVVSVTVRRPSAKKIALFALGGSALGALAGGSRCKGPTDTYYNGTTTYSTCRNSNGYYFDGKGGAIGAGAGAALGLLGFAFPEKKILYQRSLLSKADDFFSPSNIKNSSAQKELSLESPLESADKGRDSGNVPPKTERETKSSENGNCHAAQE
jgi:hypothetical protein